MYHFVTDLIPVFHALPDKDLALMMAENDDRIVRLNLKDTILHFWAWQFAASLETSDFFSNFSQLFIVYNNTKFHNIMTGYM